MWCWCGYLPGAKCNCLHMVQLMPLPPHRLLLIQIQNGSAFMVPAYPGCPGKEAVKWGVVIVRNKRHAVRGLLYVFLCLKIEYFTAAVVMDCAQLFGRGSNAFYQATATSSCSSSYDVSVASSGVYGAFVFSSVCRAQFHSAGRVEWPISAVAWNGV